MFEWRRNEGQWETQELWCHGCQRYVRFDVDVSKDGNHVFECPNCGHEHCRVVRDGRITDIRWDQRNGPTISAHAISTGTSSASTSAGSIYLWRVSEDEVWISLIQSVTPGQGDFSSLLKGLEAAGYDTAVPGPLRTMQRILARKGYAPELVDTAGQVGIEVWRKVEPSEAGKETEERRETMLERDKLEPFRYEYLDRGDSDLYDRVKDSDDEKDKIIKGLLERIAALGRSSHARETK